MIANPQSGRLAAGVVLAVGLALGLCACVADGGSASAALQVAESTPRQSQPRLATYDCGQDGTITVESMHSAVRLVEAEGSSYDLPASPPTQANRFGEGNVALVVEGGEALWMKAGREPIACKR